MAKVSSPINVFDGASIHRISWTLTGSPFQPGFIEAALVHDFLFYDGRYTRKVTNKIFLELLKLNGVSKFTRSKMYFAVWAFSLPSWRKWRKKQKQTSS